MIRTLERTYKEREQEVQIYISMLEKLNDIDVFSPSDINSIDMHGNAFSFQLSNTDLQICRASFYLILYNLVEATTNEIIKEVTETISSEGLEINQLTPKIRNLYIDSLIGEKESKNKILSIVHDLVKDSIDCKKIEIEDICINISGNVNYEFINKLIASIGCTGRLSVDKDALSDAMNRTKEYRNKLAHGNLSFVEVGRSRTIQDLRKDYNIVTKYLEDVIKNCVKYLDDKKYLV